MRQLRPLRLLAVALGMIGVLFLPLLLMAGLLNLLGLQDISPAEQWRNVFFMFSLAGCDITLSAMLIWWGFRPLDNGYSGYCSGCGYDLRGSVGRPTCPECGADIPRESKG
jgi:hypothetical protein